MKSVSFKLVLGLMVGGLLLLNAAQPVAAASIEEKLDRLERLFQQQQQQIESQARTIEQLQNKLDARPEVTPAPVVASDQAVVQPDKPVVQSGNEKVKVKLYGQVNRGVLVVDDGDSTNTYQVDNDNSSTRVGLLGSLHNIKDWTLGSRFEVEFESNSSSAVSQKEQSGVGGNNFHERWIEVYVNSPYGKLSLGQGDTASNATSEVDLSGTSLAGYSELNGVAGGQLFYANNTNSLSSTKAKKCFQ